MMLELNCRNCDYNLTYSYDCLAENSCLRMACPSCGFQNFYLFAIGREYEWPATSLHKVLIFWNGLGPSHYELSKLSEVISGIPRNVFDFVSKFGDHPVLLIDDLSLTEQREVLDMARSIELKVEEIGA